MFKKQKILLFDIDGTLLLTGGVGKVAIEKTFETLFKIPSAEVWGGLIPDGKTDPMIFQEIADRVLRRSLTAAEHHAIHQIYLDYFRTHIDDAPRFRVLPGVMDLIKTLHSIENLFLAIQTGNFESVAWLKLERGQLKPYFKTGGFGSDGHHRKELVQKALERSFQSIGAEIPREDITLIGDAKADILAGNSLGIRTIAVLTGSTPFEELQSLNPTHIVNDLSDQNLFLDLIHK